MSERHHPNMSFEVSKNVNLPLEKPAQALAGAGDIIEISKPFDLRAAIQLLLEKWRLILGVSFAVAVAATCLTLFTTVKYQTKSVLQVDQEELRIIGTDTVIPQDLKSPEALNTIVQNVKNSSVLRRVVQDNKLI